MTTTADLLAYRPSWQLVLRTVDAIDSASAETIAQQCGIDCEACRRILRNLAAHGHIALVGTGGNARWMSKAVAKAHAKRIAVLPPPPESAWWNRGIRVMRVPTPAELAQLAECGL